jgi:hypothetical protein
MYDSERGCTVLRFLAERRTIDLEWLVLMITKGKYAGLPHELLKYLLAALDEH